ncbi:CaiB/BaiF CoA transferase family protein [Chloroflexota bacterium]
MEGALSGIRILEWCYFHMGPTAAVILSDLGAEVVKIEEAVTGDPQRGAVQIAGIATGRPGGNANFDSLNRNKRSICIDLKNPEGRQIVYGMIPKFDVFITSFRTKAIERLGLDYETLKGYNPQLVYFHGSAYGPLGPESDFAGQDFNGQARSGFAMAQREEPWAVGGIADEGAGWWGAIGILSALHARERLGKGQKIETSLLGSMITLNRTAATGVLASGQEASNFGQKAAGNPLYNFYRAGDGKWLCLSFGMGMEPRWPNLCIALDRPDLENDARFCDVEARRNNNRELIAVLDEIFQQRAREEWLQRLRERDIPASVVNRLTDLVNDPQVTENQYVAEYENPVAGKRMGVGFPLSMSESSMRTPSAAPELGQHTEEVLIELGGYNWDDISQFKEKGVIP